MNLATVKKKMNYLKKKIKIKSTRWKGGACEAPFDHPGIAFGALAPAPLSDSGCSRPAIISRNLALFFPEAPSETRHRLHVTDSA